jgi:hypothetical protein
MARPSALPAPTSCCFGAQEVAAYWQLIGSLEPLMGIAMVPQDVVMGGRFSIRMSSRRGGFMS